MVGGPDRGAARADEPARHPRPADRRRRRARDDRRRRVVRHRAPQRAVRDPAALGLRRDARPAQPAATRPTSSPSCARASSGTAMHGTLTGRPGAQRLAVTSGGTIPDRGLFGVFMVGEKAARVGELDEEMVYESRVGDVFALGATSWRIQEITHDRVLVTPAFGEPGRVPFWKGDGIGRPAELGRAIGAFIRELAELVRRRRRRAASRRAASTSARPRNLLAFLAEQRDGDRARADRHAPSSSSASATSSATGGSCCTPPTACRCTRRGRSRSRPASASGSASTAARWRPTTASSCASPTPTPSRPGPSCSCSSATSSTQIVTEEVGGSALFAVALPRVRGARAAAAAVQPRQALAALAAAPAGVAAARRRAQVPEVPDHARDRARGACRTSTTCPRCIEPRPASSRRRAVRLVEAETEMPSPFARSLLFGYVAAFMYEGDSPARRAPGGRALARLDAAARAARPRRAARAARPRRHRPARARAAAPRARPPRPRRRGRRRPAAPARPADDRAEIVERSWLADRGDATSQAPSTTAGPGSRGALGDLATRRTASCRFTHAGAERWAAIEDASRLRDALGVALPIGVPTAFVEPVDDPLGDLVGRYARTHGPFTAADGRRPARARHRRRARHAAPARGAAARRRGRVPTAAASAASGATPRCCGACAAGRSPRCGTRSSRSRPTRSAASCRPGSTSRPAPRARAARRRRRRAGHRPARRGRAARLGLGVADPARARHRLRPRHARRAHGHGRGHLVGRRQPRRATTAGSACTSPTARRSRCPSRSAPTPTSCSARCSAPSPAAARYFFRQLSDAVGSTDDDGARRRRSGTSSGPGRSRTTRSPRCARQRAAARRREPSTPTRSRSSYRSRGRVRRCRVSPGRRRSADAGRSCPWPSPTRPCGPRRMAEILLERYGVVTRGAVHDEGVRGGFAPVYKVLSGFEETGRARRGYFVERLGAAQFATGPTVDRLRSFVREESDRRDDDALASAGSRARDPRRDARRDRPGEPVRRGAAVAGNPPRRHDGPVAVGAGADDPAATGTTSATGSTADDGLRGGLRLDTCPAPAPTKKTGHRPGRKAGALVVLVDGASPSTSSAAARPCSPSASPTSASWPLAAQSLASRRPARGSASSRSSGSTASSCSAPRSATPSATPASARPPSGVRHAVVPAVTRA